jgi:hypothetical protein
MENAGADDGSKSRIRNVVICLAAPLTCAPPSLRVTAKVDNSDVGETWGIKRVLAI